MKGALIVAALIGIVAIVLLGQFAWLRIGRAKVSSDGSVIESARVYRNRAGDLLIDLRRHPDELYVVCGTTVGIPNRTFAEFSPIRLARQTLLPFVDIRDEKAGAVDPHLSVSPQGVTFETGNGRILRVNWN